MFQPTSTATSGVSSKFEPPDVEPGLQDIREQLNNLADVTDDDLHWAYEKGATSIEEALELIASDERGEDR